MKQPRAYLFLARLTCTREAHRPGHVCACGCQPEPADVAGLPGTRECRGRWDDGRDRREQAEPQGLLCLEAMEKRTGRRPHWITGPPEACRPPAPGAVKTGRLVSPGRNSTLLWVPWVTVTLWGSASGVLCGEMGGRRRETWREGGTRRESKPPPERLQRAEHILQQEMPTGSAGWPLQQTVHGQLRRPCHTLGRGRSPAWFHAPAAHTCLKPAVRLT